jgi:hypothetical protein
MSGPGRKPPSEQLGPEEVWLSSSDAESLNGGRAFPRPGRVRGEYGGQRGMTLREWYAGMALREAMRWNQSRDGFDSAAHDAVCMADALLRRLGR